MGREKGYRVLGLREGITLVGYLAEARQLILADWRRRRGKRGGSFWATS